MKVMDVMSRPVISVKSDSTLNEVAALMKKHDVGSVVVMSGAVHAGVITDRDIAVRALAAGLDPKKALAREAMTSEPVTCWADDDVDKAAAAMTERKVRRLLVLDRSRHPVGVLSLGDLAANEATSLTGCGVLREVCADLGERKP